MAGGTAVERLNLYLDRAEHICKSLDECYETIDEYEKDIRKIRDEQPIDEEAQVAMISPRIQFLEQKAARMYLRLETALAQVDLMERWVESGREPPSDLEKLKDDGKVVGFSGSLKDENIPTIGDDEEEDE